MPNSGRDLCLLRTGFNLPNQFSPGPLLSVEEILINDLAIQLSVFL